MKIQLYFFILISFVNVGCEKEAFIDYKVSNKSSQEIKVVFYNMDSYDQATSNTRDSVLIGVNEEKLIVVQTKGVSKVSKYKETETHLREFEYFEVYQQGIKSKTDFSLSSEWDYTEQNKHSATYTCVVNQTDF